MPRQVWTARNALMLCGAFALADTHHTTAAPRSRRILYDLISCEPVVIKLFFALLVLCTAALIIVGLAIHFRVKRHLRQEQMDAQVRAAIEGVAESTTEEKTS